MRHSERTKILIIGLTNVMGGVETFIYNTTVFSDKTKYQYEFLIHGDEKDCVFRKEINEFYERQGGFYFVPKYKSSPFKCLAALNKFFKENGRKYKYIHVHTGLTAEILYCFPFCLMYRNKVIVHSHYSGGKNTKQNKLFRPLVNVLVNKRLACSVSAARWMFGEKNVKKACIINNGIDTERFSYQLEPRKKIRQKYGVENQFIVGHVGRFSSEKNHDFLIDVFEAVKKKKRNAMLMLVGTGELEQEIRDKVQAKKLEGSILFTGVQSNINEYYSAFDCFVMTSWFEGLPVVGVEAQAAGLPCLFSDGIPKKILITDRAKTVPLSDSAEVWAELICKDEVNFHREQYADIVDKQGYGVKNTVKKLEEVYSIVARNK